MSSNEVDDQNDNITQEHACLSHWNPKELEELLTAIKNGSENDPAYIQEKILSKTEQEVKDAICYCRSVATKLAAEKPSCSKRIQRSEVKKEPIRQWLDLMSTSYSLKELSNIAYADALNDVAKQVSPPNEVEGVEFNKIYMYLAKACKGEVLPSLNSQTRFVLNQCLRELIQCAKTELEHNKQLIQHLKSLDSKNILELEPPLCTDDDTNMDFLVSQVKYNPLKIPFECLAATKPPNQSSSRE